jgi:hypothetical protein
VTVGIEEYQKGYGTQKFLQTTSTHKLTARLRVFPELSTMGFSIASRKLRGSASKRVTVWAMGKAEVLG